MKHNTAQATKVITAHVPLPMGGTAEFGKNRTLS